MECVVIRLQGEDGKGTCLISLDQDTVLDGMPSQIFSKGLRQLEFTPSPDGPRSNGEVLLSALYKHSAIQWALVQALGRDRQIPIFLKVDDGGDAGDELPWETLFHTEQSFLALSENWPILRTKQLFGKRKLTRELTVSGERPEVRMLAVLAAPDAGWKAELEALESAIDSAAQKGCKLRIRVLHSVEPKYLPAGQAGRNPVEFIPFADVSVLWDAISEYHPNILHFFCHGSVDNGAKLHIEKVLYTKVPESRNVVHVAPEDILGNLPIDRHPWMAVLNACSTAGGNGPAQNSFARLLVGPKVPLVIANRVPVVDSDASLMTQSFYRSLMAKIAEAPTAAGGVEWADGLRQARLALVNRHRGELTGPESAAKNDPWSRPVFYTVPMGFTLQPARDANAFRSARDETFAEVTEQLELIPLRSSAKTDERARGGNSTAVDMEEYRRREQEAGAQGQVTV